MAHKPNVELRFGCVVCTVKTCAESLGELDLVIDAYGVYSLLCYLRMLHEGGPRWRGLVLLHGAIMSDPESSLPHQALSLSLSLSLSLASWPRQLVCR